jgi:DNA-binding CsgD family transcriptional regulator
MKQSIKLMNEEQFYHAGIEANKNLNYSKAEDYFRSSKSISKKNRNKKWEMQSSVKLAISLFRTRNINDSLKELNYCQNYINRYGSKEMKIEWMIAMSRIKAHEENYAKALVYLENCEELEVELYPNLLHTYIKMRIHCYYILGIYKIANQECMRGLKLVDKSSQFDTYIYYKMSWLECEELIDDENPDLDAWWALWEETEAHADQVRVQLLRSQILSSIMYLIKGSKESKEEKYKIANLFHTEIENSDYKSSSEYLPLITLYINVEDYQKAEEILTKYRNAASNTKNKLTNQIIEGMQQYLIDQKIREPKIAEESFRKLIDNVENEDFSKLGIMHRTQIYKEISDLYKHRLDYKKALEYSEKYTQELIQDKRESSNILREQISILLEENKNKKASSGKEESEYHANRKLNLEKASAERKQFFHSKQFMAKVEKLASELPQLSPTELKISVLIGSNYSNYEIMETMGVTIRTVEKHRLQIRKKMNLTPKSNLVVKLLNILSK